MKLVNRKRSEFCQSTDIKARNSIIKNHSRGHLSDWAREQVYRKYTDRCVLHLVIHFDTDDNVRCHGMEYIIGKYTISQMKDK